ncbi:MAG: tRNA (uridine(54)-C5)-methyltransferase TrmA [Azoarcus sp.]|nr:tRNA (uridine(54)-C5)-methyltransferase TrmA [Azoarcus sp.]
MPLSRIDPSRYPALLAEKTDAFRRAFAGFNLPAPQIFASPHLGYRMRAEFRMWHEGRRVSYAMFSPADPRRPVTVQDFPPAIETIRNLMPKLREHLLADDILRARIFQTEFLATRQGEALATLIYHRPLDAQWEESARRLADSLGIHIIGRSRGQKIVIGRDFLEEEIEVDGLRLRTRQVEGGFSQPNGEVNRAMLGWVRKQAAMLGGDLLELYCGNGNFTVALAPLFNKVLATELSKTSVAAARWGLQANSLNNVALARMASFEVSSALARERVFRRLQEQNINLDDWHFTTLFVDPPRAGLDADTLNLARSFCNILYISCNPNTLRENITQLSSTHTIAAAAIFDQFPYTEHLEAGVMLVRDK